MKWRAIWPQRSYQISYSKEHNLNFGIQFTICVDCSFGFKTVVLGCFTHKQLSTHLTPSPCWSRGPSWDHVQRPSLNVTRISLPLSDWPIYYPVYVKPSRVAWHGIFLIWKHQWPSLTFYCFFFSCPFCSRDICFVVCWGEAKRCGATRRKIHRKMSLMSVDWVLGK